MSFNYISKWFDETPCVRKLMLVCLQFRWCEIRRIITKDVGKLKQRNDAFDRERYLKFCSAICELTLLNRPSWMGWSAFMIVLQNSLLGFGWWNRSMAKNFGKELVNLLSSRNSLFFHLSQWIFSAHAVSYSIASGNSIPWCNVRSRCRVTLLIPSALILSSKAIVTPQDKKVTKIPKERSFFLLFPHHHDRRCSRCHLTKFDLFSKEKMPITIKMKLR